MFPKQSSKYLSMLAIFLCVQSMVWLGARDVSADLVWAFFDPATESYRYEIAHMTDLDQRREEIPPFIEGLPEAGSMYCVPTSTMNVIMYMANHGFPELDPPGPNLWELQSLYTDATRLIFDLGEEMNTDGVEGTNGYDWLDGARAWLNPYDKFTVNANFADGNSGPTMTDMALSAVTGSLIAFGYARYQHFPFETECDGGVCNLSLGEAIGGHIVTLAHASRTLPFGEMILGARDPASGDTDKTRQSFFSTKFYDVERHTGTSTDGWSRTVDLLNLDLMSTSVNLISGYIMIKPKSGYTLVDGGHQILQRVPYQFSNHTPQRADPIDAPAGGTIFALTDHPDNLGFLGLVESISGQNALYLFNLLTGSPEHLLDVDDAIALTLARNRSIYALRDDGFGGSIIQRIALDPEPVVVASREDAPFRAMTADDTNHEIVVLEIFPGGGTIERFNFDLSERTWIAETDAGVPIGDDPHIEISPIDGLTWILSDAADELFGMDRDGDLVESLPVPDPSGFSFDDKGNLFVVSTGVVKEFTRTGAGIWQEVVNSPFAGMESDGLVRISRSRNNYTPDYDQSLSPKHIDPDDVLSGTAVPDGTVDIIPGSPQNVVNIRSQGIIQVAILTTDSLNALDVDPTSVTFGRNGTDAEPVQSIMRDADEDEDIDLVLHFRQQDTGILCDDTAASLIATTVDGYSFSASDFLRTLGCD